MQPFPQLVPLIEKNCNHTIANGLSTVKQIFGS